MSGFLRRIKRSPPADAGEPQTEGQAATSEGAAATRSDDPAASAASDPSTQRTAWMQPTEPEPKAAEEAPDAAVVKPQPKPAEPPKPVLLANPGTPAGLELAEQTAPRPPAGRRGRLRRRLRYLRRARELMLRDLGGLLFEIHRTGGGNVDAHSTVVNAKLQRITGLDAEAHALELALASPRSEDIIFQPGIGGTCPTCGELYSSAAHFCTNCGASVKDLPAPTPPPAPAVTTNYALEPGPADLTPPVRRRFWKRVVGKGAVAPADTAGPEDRTGEIPAAGAESGDAPAATESAPAAGDAPPATTDAAAGDAAAENDPAAGEAAPADAATSEPEAAPAEAASTEPEAAPTDAASTEPEAALADAATSEPDEAAPTPDEAQESLGGQRNGRGDEPSGLEPGDPLVTRRSRS